MGLKTFIMDFAGLRSKDSLRLWIPFILPKSNYKYDKINNFLAFCESGSRPKGGIKDEDEGEAISLGGEQIGVDGGLNLSKIPYVSFEFYENTNKGKVKDNDILICKDGALTGKTCFVDFSLLPSKEVMINEHVYILRGNKNTNQRFLFYFTTTNIFQSQVKDLAYKKKAQPGLNIDHFRKIKIPSIPKTKQEQIVTQIEPIEKNIKGLKVKIKQPQEVINKVFAREFGFDLDKFKDLEKEKFFKVEFSNFVNHRDLRFSIGIKKANIDLKPFVSKPFKYISLGKIISLEYGSGLTDQQRIKGIYPVMGANGRVGYNNQYLIEGPSIIVGRKGSAGEINYIEENSYPIDTCFYVKFLHKQNIIYFAYLLKFLQLKRLTLFKGVPGLNRYDVYDVKIPNLQLSYQQKIVDEIRAELDNQEVYKKKIEAERKKIDYIIENAIT